MTKHTPTPWFEEEEIGGAGIFYRHHKAAPGDSGLGLVISGFDDGYPQDPPNRARIVACVNAFHSSDGREIKTEKIEEGVFWTMLDELREAEGKLGMFIRENEDPGADALALQYRLRALLAKLEE